MNSPAASGRSPNSNLPKCWCDTPTPTTWRNKWRPFRVDLETKKVFWNLQIREKPSSTGITLDEFKSFFFFLNNLEDFSTAIHYYTLANTPIGPAEFKRAVRISTGQDLSDNLVMTVYAIFDKDGDMKLSQKEFIGVMSDRFARQQKVTFSPSTVFRALFKTTFSN